MHNRQNIEQLKSNLTLYVVEGGDQDSDGLGGGA